MAEPSTNKVTVRVEVVVEGAAGGPAVTVQKETQGRVKPPFRAIISPQPYPPSRTPVIRSGGVNYVAANGGSQVINGQFPRRVCALAFPSPNEDPFDYPSPPPGAVCVAPGADGSWSFGAVPGAACDNNPYPTNNSTLIVWFDYGTPGDPDYAVVTSTPFYGVCPASGPSGGTSGAGRSLPAQLHATVLHATFTGALAPLGTVALRWNGAAWVGVSTHCGGAALSFLGLEAACHLVSSGPGAAFVVAAPPDSFHPFHWSAAGSAVGAVAGPFHVTVTE